MENMATPKPKTKFEPTELKGRTGWCVRIMLPSGIQPQIDGFETEAEARDWIKARSTAWLKMYESGKYT
jgi:hypothetical protein